MSSPVSPTLTNPLSIEEQHKHLDEALFVVRTQSALMAKGLEAKQIMEAMKNCSEMLNELRTSALSPKLYYELYLSIFDQLRSLLQQLKEMKSDPIIPDLYELVQYAGSIIPRLYMMITVGALYIELKESERIEVLKDMIDMCRGVQHPTRGLFLRHYLSCIVKDCLPDINSLHPGETINDSIEFILTNFVEMNKLWVRMQYLGPTKEREKREAERKELKILVGTNLVRLSQLEGVDCRSYKDVVLPQILEQIVGCKDAIAQEYLMEVIIQVFPDEFHLRTLDVFLSATTQLVSEVSVKGLIISLIDRLSNYAIRNEGGKAILQEIKLFEIFWHHINEMNTARSDIPLVDLMSLSVALLNLVISCYPEKESYVNEVLKFTYNALEKSKASNIDVSDPTCGKLVVKLLKIPLEMFKNIVKILPLEYYQRILNFLSTKTKKIVSRLIGENMIQHNTFLKDSLQLEKLVQLIQPLLKSDQNESHPFTNSNKEGYKKSMVIELDDFLDEQYLVAKIIHHLKADEHEKQLELLNQTYRFIKDGGCLRIRFTIPSLIFQIIELTKSIADSSSPDKKELITKCQKLMFTVITNLLNTNEDELHQLISNNSSEFCWFGSFSSNYVNEISLLLFLQAVKVSDYCYDEDMAYEFAVQAFTVYEEQVSDTKSQNRILPLIIKAIKETTVFSEEKYDTLASKCVLYSNKLLKKPDQCRAICVASHLFWGTGYETYKDGKRVLECLQKALKIADTCMDAVMNIQLFIEILNYCIYFYKYGNNSITTKYLDSLIDLIQANLSNMESHDLNESVSKYFKSTSRYFLETKEVRTFPGEFKRKLKLETTQPVEQPTEQSSSSHSEVAAEYQPSPAFEISEEQPW